MNNLKTQLTIAFLFCCFSVMALNPSRTYKQLPEKYNMEYTAHKVKTNDGNAELNIWDFPCKSGKTTNLILIAHNGEGNMGDYLRRIDQFRAHYNVVAFDYRGFGESSDFEIDRNMYVYPHFQDDMETMFDWCRKQHVATFHVYGWGIGGGLALGVGWSRPETRRIIADTPFLSMEDLEYRFSEWEEPMEVPFAGYEKRFEPKNAIEGVAPGKHLEGVKLIIGSNDILFSKSDLEAMQKQQPKLIDKAVFVVENPDRKDNFMVDKGAYFKAVDEFLALSK